MKKIFRLLSLLVSKEQVIAAIAFDLRAFGVLTSSAGFAAYLVGVEQPESALLMLLLGVIIWIVGLLVTIIRRKSWA